MLFLPGTYFAALWAVPSLKWGQSNVIQSDFWVYWAFTGPSTLLTFAVWFGLHKWKFSRSQIQGPSQQLAGYEKLNDGSTDSYYRLTSPPSVPPPPTSIQYESATSTTSAPPDMSFRIPVDTWRRLWGRTTRIRTVDIRLRPLRMEYL